MSEFSVVTKGATSSEPEPWAVRFCREADTVVEGFLCDEPTVVSNACRQPSNAFDAYVCDEPRMRSLQHRVIEATVSIVEKLLVQWIRG